MPSTRSVVQLVQQYDITRIIYKCMWIPHRLQPTEQHILLIVNLTPRINSLLPIRQGGALEVPKGQKEHTHTFLGRISNTTLSSSIAEGLRPALICSFAQGKQRDRLDGIVGFLLVLVAVWFSMFVPICRFVVWLLCVCATFPLHSSRVVRHHQHGFALAARGRLVRWFAGDGHWEERRGESSSDSPAFFYDVQSMSTYTTQ